MFLRVLYEVQYGSMIGCSNNVNSLIYSWFKKYWNFDLSDDERKLLLEGIREMHSSALIQNDESHRSSDYVVLTETGKDIVELNLDPESKVKKYF